MEGRGYEQNDTDYNYQYENDQQYAGNNDNWDYQENQNDFNQDFEY